LVFALSSWIFFWIWHFALFSWTWFFWVLACCPPSLACCGGVVLVYWGFALVSCFNPKKDLSSLVKIWFIIMEVKGSILNTCNLCLES
jgi:hypothetical protein